MRLKRYQEGGKTALEKALEVKPPSFTRPNPFVKKKAKGKRRAEETERSIKEKVREYQTNPNQMKGESDAEYKVRHGRMKEERKRKLSPLRRKTEELQEKREKLPYLEKMAAEIAMSPIDIAESLTDKMDIGDTEKYKSSKDKRQDLINLGDSALDAGAWLGGGVAKEGAKTLARRTFNMLVKKYGKKAMREVVGEEAFNQFTKLNQSL